MARRMIIMLIGVGLLFGLIFGYQFFKSYMMKKYMAEAGASATVTVSTMKASPEAWQNRIRAAGSLRAVRGVDVTTELAGLVRTIQFTPGANVKQGQQLVKLNDDAEVAQLHSLEASAELARITYERDKAQYAVQAVSKQVVDNDAGNLKSLIAQVEQQRATVAKKNITAPFSGRLGINYVNPGQYVNVGDKIVTLQTLDPIYIDFYLPQQELVNIRVGQTITAVCDTYPGKTFTGKITTINPIVDTATRNVQVEATVANSKQLLLPGMFATVEVTTGKPQNYLTLPQTAISYNPYGDIAYIVREQGKNKKGEPILTVTQTFVSVGSTRGDQVAITKGINEGDIVVVAGQLKLKNGSHVKINNTVMPKNNPDPKPLDE
ncbi:MAG: efflux transporter periplasmic adaptor subunit [Gammaproteobacteria bacterium 39-13]|nr:efflux RND transporter periplasmic adaptor subunit [Gammaproteobacteria bacterium]OJV93076.1 MAG: efflux transporter periplasmic adaptor subunit [Gammaproteobacteria bacterium 39-13]